MGGYGNERALMLNGELQRVFFVGYCETIVLSYVHLSVLGILGGPIIASMYSSCSEVLMGQEVHTLFTLTRMAVGLSLLIGPALAGVYMFSVHVNFTSI